MLTWILRAVGFLAMLIGLLLIAKPLVTLADVLPFLGSLLGVGVGLLALTLALPLTLVTVGIAWLFYRPLLGVGLLVAAAALFVLLKKIGAGRRVAPATSAPTA
jgi:hypothetical protein